MNHPESSKRVSSAGQSAIDPASQVQSAAWAMLQALEELHAGQASAVLARALPAGWTMNRLRLAVGKENDVEVVAKAEPVGLGVPIGVNDAAGRPIHIGDTLDFEEREYGCPCRFTIELNEGSIQHPGVTSDLSEFCEIAIPWDAKPEPKGPDSRRP